MVYSTVVFTWVTAAAINITVSFPTSGVVDGYCWTWWFWPSKAVKMTYSVLYFIFYFFNLVAIFIYCYSHILSDNLQWWNQTERTSEQLFLRSYHVKVLGSMLWLARNGK